MTGHSDESADTAGSTDDGLLGGGGLDRRSLIKKAGIVGAAAWVAPMVLDSVLSPASAASLAPGNYKLRLSSEQCDPTPVRDPNDASAQTQACLPIDWPSATLTIADATQLGNLGLSVVNCSRRYLLTVSSSNANVTFLSGTSCKPKSQGGGPNNGVVAVGGGSITWALGIASDRNGYFIVVHVA